MKTAIKTILYLLGFPLLAVFIYLESRNVLEMGESYGIMTYVGLIVVCAVTLLYVATGLITWAISRKAKTRGTIRRCTAALVIIAVFFTTGLWIIIDRVMPDILSDGTSGTITYDDVREDYDTQAEYQRLLLDKFIKMNVANGNLTEYTEEEYLEQGYRNEEVQNLIETNHKSLEDDGYNTFVGPWIDLAVDGRTTVPTILHLVINDRQESTENPDVEDIIFIYPGEGRAEAGKTESPIKWTILDMQEGNMSFDIDLGGLISGEGNESLIETIGVVYGFAGDSVDSIINGILDGINAAIMDEDFVGSVINIDVKLNLDPNKIEDAGVSININPASESRGVWDYMHNAWLNSNGLLFMVCSLFPARNVMLFFGGIVAVLSLIIGAIRERQYKKNYTKDEIKQTTAKNDATPESKKTKTVAVVKMRRANANPYAYACFRSFNDMDTSGLIPMPKKMDPKTFD